MKVKCDYCRKEVEKKPSVVKLSKHHFCSIRCRAKWISENRRGKNHPQYARKTVKCEYCGKRIEKASCELKSYRHHFCSRECCCNFQRILVKCDYCGKLVKKKKGKMEKHNHHFCSRECYFKWNTGKNHPGFSTQIVKCDYCGIEFSKVLSRVGRSKYNFCSSGCRNNFQDRRIEARCIRCGVTFYRKQSSISRPTHPFCSVTCYHEWNTGKNNVRWMGGHEPYYGTNWKAQRRNARRRDNYTCQTCDKKEDGHELDVHHIVPFREFGLDRYKEANQLGNLVTLCHSCHTKLERRS